MASKENSATPPCGATPRKSNLGGGEMLEPGGERVAPLGFEPEGSATSGTPPIAEVSGTTPPYYKWVENIHFLLEDVDGVDLFSRFLEQEDIVDVLPFYFAVKGLRDKTLQSKPDKIQQLIKLIFKKYLRGDRVMLILKSETRKAIHDKMTNKDGGRSLEPDIFVDAQEEVLDYLSSAPYSAFLKSDLYVQYVQSGGLESNPGESVESSGSSSSAGSHAGTRPVSQGFLPTLHENEELELSDVPPSTSTRDLPSAASTSLPSGGNGTHRGSSAGGVNVMPLSLKSLMATRHSRSGPTGEYPTSQHRRNVDAQGRAINPYHMTYCSSYNPVSAQDSELQSLSSDALTDTDTLGSLTDSSVDRYPVVQTERFRKRQVKQEHRAIRNSAAQNHDDLVTHHRFIPRTERLPKDIKPTAETDFEAFAKDLTQRLEKVLEKQVKEEKLEESLRMLNVVSPDQHHHKSIDDHGVQPPPVPRKTGIPTSASIPGGASGVPSFKGLLFSSLMASRGAAPPADTGIDDDEAQAILDEHVSKWDKSGHHTPRGTRSPPNGRSGRGSGLSTGLPPRHRRHKGGASSSGIGSGSDRNTDTSSLISKDSGVSKDYLIPYQGNQDHLGVPEAMKTGFHVVGAFPQPGHPQHVAMQQQQQQMAFFKNQGGGNPGFEMMDPSMRNLAAFRSQGPPPTSHNVNMMGGRSKSRLTVHSTDTGSSCVDSGVSGVYVGGASATSNSEGGQSGGPKPLPYSEKVIAWMQDNENFSTDYKKSGSSYEASEGRSSARNRSDRGNNNNGDHRSDSRKASIAGGQGSLSPALHRSERVNKRAVAAVAPTMPLLPPGANGNHPTSYHHFGPPGTPLASNSAWPTSMTANDMIHRHSGSGSTTRQASAAASLMNEKTSKKSSSSNPAGLNLHAGTAQLASPSLPTSSVSSGVPGFSSASSSSVPAATNSSTNAAAAVSSSSSTVCGYYFCGEPIPYRVSIPGKNPTLAQFKSLLNKKGSFRFFFKKHSDEFDSGVIFAEVSDDNAPLPYWEGKIVGKVERLE